MSEGDRSNANRAGTDGGRTHASTSVLIAAVSLLATSLGVSAATSVDSMAPRGFPPRPTFDRLAELAVGRVPKAQSKYESSQLKLKRPLKSMQYKRRTR
jgi:hypothetical protein